MWSLVLVAAGSVGTIGVYDVEHRCHWAAQDLQRQGVVASCVQTRENPNLQAEEEENTRQTILWANEYNAKKAAKTQAPIAQTPTVQAPQTK